MNAYTPTHPQPPTNPSTQREERASERGYTLTHTCVHIMQQRRRRRRRQRPRQRQKRLLLLLLEFQVIMHRCTACVCVLNGVCVRAKIIVHSDTHTHTHTHTHTRTCGAHWSVQVPTEALVQLKESQPAVHGTFNVYMYVCMYVCVCMRMYVCMHVCTCLKESQRADHGTFPILFPPSLFSLRPSLPLPLLSSLCPSLARLRARALRPFLE